MKNQEDRLLQTLERLEVSAQKIVETRGYGKDAARLRVLVELIKEQLKNENPRSTARPLR